MEVSFRTLPLPSRRLWEISNPPTFLTVVAVRLSQERAKSEFDLLFRHGLARYTRLGLRRNDVGSAGKVVVASSAHINWVSCPRYFNLALPLGERLINPQHPIAHGAGLFSPILGAWMSQLPQLQFLRQPRRRRACAQSQRQLWLQGAFCTEFR